MKLWRLLLTFVFFYLLILQVWTSWPFTIDDMYITLRYAKHWADGFGLLWNIHELPVEGYSNFSFVLLARVAILFHMNPVAFLKGAGVVGLLCTSWGVYAISRMWFLSGLAIIPCLWLLAYKGQILWGVSGLETSIYEALICGAVFFIFRGLGYSSYPIEKADYRPGAFVLSGLLLTLAGMTRPEAPALMMVYAFLLFIFRDSTSQSNRRGLVWFLVTIIVSFLPYFFWRWHYYGQLFPNPIYCKGFIHSWMWRLDKHYLLLMWPFALLAIPAFYRNHDQRDYFLWLPSILYLLLLSSADPIVAFDNRLFLPAFALFLPLTLKGLAILLKPLSQTVSVRFDTPMYFVAFLLAFFFIPMLSLQGYRHFTENAVVGEQLRRKVVTWLNQNTTAASRVVLADAGFIPYHNDRQFVDSYCLNNAEMAKLPSAFMYQDLCKKILKRKPEVIILTALLENGKVIYTPTDACLSESLSNSKYYCLQTSLGTGDKKSFYRYEIFAACHRFNKNHP